MPATARLDSQSSIMVYPIRQCLECQRNPVEDEGDQCRECGITQADAEADLIERTWEAANAGEASPSSDEDYLYMRDVGSQNNNQPMDPEEDSHVDRENHPDNQDEPSEETDSDEPYHSETSYDLARQDYRDNIARLILEQCFSRRGAVASAMANMPQIPGADEIIAEEEANYQAGITPYKKPRDDMRASGSDSD